MEDRWFGLGDRDRYVARMKTPRFTIKTIAKFTAMTAALLAVAVWFFDIPHAPVEKASTLHGDSLAQVFDRLGNPAHESWFKMDEVIGEFRVELFNTYPPNSPDNSEVEIRESTWNYSRHRLTVWFHRPNGDWVAFDTCRYRNDIQF